MGSKKKGEKKRAVAPGFLKKRVFPWGYREVQCGLEKSFTGSTSHPWMWQLSRGNYCTSPPARLQGFRQGGPGGTMDPPNIFPRKIRIFTGVWGGPWSPPQEIWGFGVLEVVDDPPWSCDPTVQSIWLAVPEEVEEKGGGAIFLKKGKSSVPCACGAVLLAM